jgi:hypothetical protein
MPSIELRPYQRPGVERLLKQGRLALAWEMSAGKSFAEIAALQEVNPERYLMVCPAIVRPMWLDLLRTYMPHRDIGAITMGPTAQAPSKRRGKEREDAYKAPYQIVSYDLCEHLVDRQYDRISCDEAAALRSALSSQSQVIKKLFRANPKSSGALLSGTLAPNHSWQLWNPLDTLFPGWAGKPTRTGDVPWSFKERYCEMELRYGHPYFYGVKNAEELKERIAPYVDRVVQADFAQYLPPLFVEALRTDVPRKQIVNKWVSNIEVPCFGIFTHLRETASHIATELGRACYQVFFITGAESAEKRAEILKQARNTERCVVVGTTHALNEGVSLSFLKAALVVEWTTQMDDVLQFIGRFARQDSASNAPTRVEFVVGPNDESRMATLRERIDAVNSILRPGRSETLGAGAFAEQRMGEEAFQAQLKIILEKVEKRSRTRGLIESDSDD